jgi:hypothetical protein
VHLLPGEKEQVSVVESPSLKGNELYEHLHRLHEEFRVDMNSDTPTLVRK